MKHDTFYAPQVSIVSRNILCRNIGFYTSEYMDEKFFFPDTKLIARTGEKYTENPLSSPLLNLFGQFSDWLLEKKCH